MGGGRREHFLTTPHQSAAGEGKKRSSSSYHRHHPLSLFLHLLLLNSPSARYPQPTHTTNSRALLAFPSPSISIDLQIAVCVEMVDLPFFRGGGGGGGGVGTPLSGGFLSLLTINNLILHPTAWAIELVGRESTTTNTATLYTRNKKALLPDIKCTMLFTRAPRPAAMGGYSYIRSRSLRLFRFSLSGLVRGV